MDQLELADPLFSAIFPAGIGWADRTRERHGDFVRLGFLSFRTLVLDLAPDCPPALAARIRTDAGAIQARAGEQFQVSHCDQYVTLGTDMKEII